MLNKNPEKSFAERVANQMVGKKEAIEDINNGYLVYIVTQEVLFNE
jgi:hypothetical protein